MAGFTKSTSQIVKEISQKMFLNLSKRKFEIEQVGTKFAQESYYDFPRPPIDTRESISTTKMEMTTLATSIFLKFIIATDYANFFRFGLSTSAKYGKRDPLMRGANKTLKYISKNLK
jgi:hypothetical protein